MLLFDKYLLKEWFRIFIISLMLTVSILILEDVYRNLQDFIESDAKLVYILKYYLFLIPKSISIVLPISYLISIVFSLNIFHQNNEIVVLRSSGLRLLRITKIYWIIGLIFSCILFVSNAYIVPFSLNYTNNLKREIIIKNKVKDRKGINLTFNFTFDNCKHGRFWFINRFDNYESRGFGLTLCILDKNGCEKERFISEEIMFEKEKNTWIALHGKHITFDVLTGEVLKSNTFEKKFFYDFDETPQLMKNLSEKIDNLSLENIREILYVLDSKNNKSFLSSVYQTRYYELLFDPLICFLIVGFAIPFVLVGVRKNYAVNIFNVLCLFFAYHIIQLFCKFISEKQILLPIISSIIPFFTMLITVFILFKTKTNE